MLVGKLLYSLQLRTISGSGLVRNWVGNLVDLEDLQFLWLSDELVKSLFVEHFEVVLEDSLFGLSLLGLLSELGFSLSGLLLESDSLSLLLLSLLLLGFLSGLLSILFGELLHDWVPLGKMLSLVDANVLSIVLEDEELLVVLNVLDRV